MFCQHETESENLCDIKENRFYYCVISSFSFHTLADSVFCLHLSLMVSLTIIVSRLMGCV